MKAVRAAHATHQNWKQQLYKLTVPGNPTRRDQAPFRLLFNREPKSRLPNVGSYNRDRSQDEQTRRKDDHAKSKAKEYADRQNNTRYRDFEVGDRVLVKRDRKENKLSTTYKPQPYTISAKTGNMLTAKTGSGDEITRNSSRFKKLSTSIHIPEMLQEEEVETVPETPPPPVKDMIKVENATNANTAVTNQSSRNRPRRSRREPLRMKDYVKY